MWHCTHQTKDLDWIIKKSDYLFDLEEDKINKLKGYYNNITVNKYCYNFLYLLLKEYL